MAEDADSAPPIRLLAGGHRGQLVVLVGFLIAAIVFFLFAAGGVRFAGSTISLVGTVMFSYRYLNKSTVAIYADRIEFRSRIDDFYVINFSNIVSIDYYVPNRGAVNYYVSVQKQNGEERILLPHVYQDVFSPLKRSLIKWCYKDEHPSALQDISDGASDKTLWKVPRWKITEHPLGHA